jgi:hypothetical protein
MGLLMVNPEFAAARSLRTRNLRFIVRRSLFVVHCSSFIARRSLLVVHCSLFIARQRGRAHRLIPGLLSTLNLLQA